MCAPAVVFTESEAIYLRREKREEREREMNMHQTPNLTFYRSGDDKRVSITGGHTFYSVEGTHFFVKQFPVFLVSLCMVFLLFQRNLIVKNGIKRSIE